MIRQTICLLAFSCLGFAQVEQQPASPNPNQQLPAIRPEYILGPNDQILIRAPQAEEINERPFRVDSEGFITLPIVGRIRAAGLTIQALEAAIVAKLREYVREPVVSISPVQFRSEPVFFMGLFQKPGIYPLQGRRTLVEMLSYVGGLQPNASRRIRVTRRSDAGTIPLPNAVVDPEKKVSTVEISMDSLTQSVNPAEDLVLQPYDLVVVERADRIYVSGEVAKQGTIELAERPSISIAQALSESGGFTKEASREKVRILRAIAGTSRRAEIDIDVKKVFEGKANDFPLQPNDVLYVPRATARALFAPVGTSLLTSMPFLALTIATILK
jgi:polysaccharide export outer membrane protein